MFFLRVLKWVFFSDFCMGAFELLGAMAFLLLAWYDDSRASDDFVLIVNSRTFQDGELEYSTRRSGGDTESCKVPSDSHSIHPVGSKVLVSVNMFSSKCTPTAFIE